MWLKGRARCCLVQLLSGEKFVFTAALRNRVVLSSPVLCPLLCLSSTPSLDVHNRSTPRTCVAICTPKQKRAILAASKRIPRSVLAKDGAPWGRRVAGPCPLLQPVSRLSTLTTGRRRACTRPFARQKGAILAAFEKSLKTFRGRVVLFSPLLCSLLCPPSPPPHPLWTFTTRSWVLFVSTPLPITTRRS
ncbi:hypothetical protein F5148DRAFT_477335 [Russula earlei]|uniref:Uncharacterized protein n=1 Tax=Russula earlei TaxID=71964 RepID=A0ACC0TZK7_9AGAM|nr:hypothetical protein F5148DRAFT_477335 [Russula earlei]